MSIQAFYSLTSEPFHKSIKTKDLFESEASKELHSRLEYMANHCGLMMITGEPGSGKTTGLRKFVNSLNTQRYKTFYIPLSTVNVMDFYRQINKELGAPSKYRKADLFRSIQDSIMDYSVNKKILPVIIFDEAHLLNRDNLFEIQIITNFKMDSLDPVLIIMAGQSHLKDKIKLTSLDSLSQRFHLKYHLPPLNKKEIKLYIEHRLRLAGRNDPLFTQAAVDSIYHNSKGYIRLADELAVKTMTAGALAKKDTLSEEEVFNAMREL